MTDQTRELLRTSPGAKKCHRKVKTRKETVKKPLIQIIHKFEMATRLTLKMS